VRYLSQNIAWILVGVLLNGCWLLPEPASPPVPTASLSELPDLNCSTDCTQPVCASNGFMFCNICDVNDAGLSVSPPSHCTSAPLSSASQVSSSSFALPTEAELIEFYEYYQRIQDALSENPKNPPKVINSAEGCSCFSSYKPVCSSGSKTTYMNQCLADCAGDPGYFLNGTCIEIYALPDGSSLQNFTPIIEPMLQQMSGEEFLQMQSVINSVQLPSYLQTLPPEEASELALQIALGQLLMNPESSSLISKYLMKVP
jgi:hypothetical protein